MTEKKLVNTVVKGRKKNVCKKSIGDLITLLIVCLLAFCSAESNLLTIPASVLRIDEEAFFGDTSLDEVILPEGIESIGNRAFAESSIKRVYLPASLTEIAEDAFPAGTVGYGAEGTVAAAFFDEHEGLLFEHAISTDTVSIAKGTYNIVNMAIENEYLNAWPDRSGDYVFDYDVGCWNGDGSAEQMYYFKPIDSSSGVYVIQVMDFGGRYLHAESDYCKTGALDVATPFIVMKNGEAYSILTCDGTKALTMSTNTFTWSGNDHRKMVLLADYDASYAYQMWDLVSVPATLTLSQDSVSLAVGSSVTISGGITGDDDNVVPLSFWSQNPEIASVNENNITGVSAGETTVYVETPSGISASVSVTVVDHSQSYRVINESKSWYEAEKACEALGGHLVTITSAEEQAIIEELIALSGTKAHYWIGAARNLDGGLSAWVTGESIGYTKYASGEPNNAGGLENCLELGLDGNNYVWNDCPNTNASLSDFGYICEFGEFAGQVSTGSIYMRVDLEKTWYNAEKTCEDLGGHLVAIDSSEEQNLIAQMISAGSKNNYWIGAHSESSPSFTNWVTGSAISSYTNFASGEPNNAVWYENCLEIRKETALWNDDQNSASTDKGFICEFDGITVSYGEENRISTTFGEGYYYVAAAENTNQVWDLPGYNRDQGIQIGMLNKKDKELAQIWKFEHVGNGQYYCRLGSDTGWYVIQHHEGRRVTLYSHIIGEDYKWKFYEAGDGAYYIQNCAYGSTSWVTREGTETGKKIYCADFTGETNQKWKLCPTTLRYNDGVAYKINSLATKYPNGKYWNHYIADSAAQWPGEHRPDFFSDSVTDHGCSTHDGSPIGGYGCNSFDRASQCWGFANKLYYEVFGVLCSDTGNTTTHYDKWSIQPGDHVRYNGHSVFVWSRDGDVLIIIECNGEAREDCNIRWGRKININEIVIGNSGFIKHANNWETINQSH